MPLQATSGAASYDAFGGGAAALPTYIEDVFSTWLYTGNGSTQTITNGIDLAGEGGLVWIKSRSAATNNFLFDTDRGALNELNSNTTDAQASLASSLTAYNAGGFSLGSAAGINVNAATYASWTFRKQPKFFDVVTYTGDGSTTRTLAHSLGTASIGTIIFKRVDSTSDWIVWHRSLSAGQLLTLNSTIQSQSNVSGTSQVFNVTATTFDIDNVVYGTSGSQLNRTAITYVAYLFAHDAGGFGLTGEDNVISCGSYTGNGSTVGPVIDLGYEPQWLMIKRATGGTGNWNMFDNMRGMGVATQDNILVANTTAAEVGPNDNDWVTPNATGFGVLSTSTQVNASGSTYIYVAIRRGPMKTPTTGTSVFSSSLFTPSASTVSYTTSNQVDLLIAALRSGNNSFFIDRLRGALYSPSGVALGQTATLIPQSVGVEQSGMTTQVVDLGSNRGFIDRQYFNGQRSWSTPSVGWAFSRAPGFMDVVCYTGTGANLAVNHNLGVAPELMIVKSRSAATGWPVYSVTAGKDAYLRLDTGAYLTAQPVIWNSTTPTATQFFVGPNSLVDTSNATYVAYLFASVPGVSKVGSYTGTGSAQTIDCGFTSGARFVMIKRISGSVLDWFVWDSARGIVAGNDPYLLLNSTAAEVTNTDYIDTTSVGFEITSTAPAGINASGGTFIFLAIA